MKRPTSTNYLEAAERNRRTTVLLIGAYVLLAALGGAGVDATLMAGIGEHWFSLFGVVALGLLLPLWTLGFVARVRTFFFNSGIVDEFGYEEETSWIVGMSSLIPFAGVILIIFFSGVAHGENFIFLGILEAKNGVLSTRFPVATVAGIVFGGGGALWAWRRGEATLLALSRTRLPDPSEPTEKQFLNVVAEMSIAAGISTPRGVILRDRDANAFAVASAGSPGTIIATWGLLQALTREELQGVVAHETAHLRNRDTQVMTLLATLFGASTVLASWARRGSPLTIGRASALLIAPVWLLFGWLGPLASRLLGLAVSRQREFLADAGAVELTRNPGALIGALTKIDADRLPTWNVVRAVAPQCIVDPMGNERDHPRSWWARLHSTHPPIKDRLTLLHSMAYQ